MECRFEADLGNILPSTVHRFYDERMPMNTGQVLTVRGPVPACDIGRALMHEHLTTLVPGNYLSGGRSDDRMEMGERATRCLAEYGVRTVVNLSGRPGVGASELWPALRELSERTGLHVVAGFAYYTERWWPAGVADLSPDELTERFIDAAQSADGAGIDGTGIPAGIYGEVGTSFNVITEGEERSLRAVARAHRITGLPISTHSSLGTMSAEQIEILADEGADLEQVIIGHVDLKPEVNALEAMLRTGVTLAFDTFGKEYFDYVLTDQENHEPGNVLKRVYHRPDSARLDALAALVAKGWQKQLVLSTDLTGRETYLNEDTHGEYGYSYIPERVLPALLQRGVSEAAIETILAENPRRLLTVRR